MKVIQSPNRITEAHENNIKVFLAGTIEMGNSVNWQQEVIKHFKNYSSVTLFNPRRDDWNPKWKQDITTPQFNEQVCWELNALDQSDIIIMYFDPTSKSPVSLLELGLYANSKKIHVVCPEGFWRRGNVQIVCKKYNIPFYENIKELLNKNKYD